MRPPALRASALRAGDRAVAGCWWQRGRPIGKVGVPRGGWKWLVVVSERHRGRRWYLGRDVRGQGRRRWRRVVAAAPAQECSLTSGATTQLQAEELSDTIRKRTSQAIG